MRERFKFGPLNDPYAPWQWGTSLPNCVARYIDIEEEEEGSLGKQTSRVTTTDMDATEGSEASKSLLGPLNGKFIYKKNVDGTINKNVVICSLCKKEFAFHRSCSSLTYHLNAKHVRTSSNVSATVNVGANATVSSLRQTTLAECGKRMSKATTEKLTNSIAKWIAADCRPISIVADEGLQEAFQIAASDPSFQLPSRTTVMKRIHQLYEDERKAKEEVLAGACHVAPTFF